MSILRTHVGVSIVPKFGITIESDGAKFLCHELIRLWEDSFEAQMRDGINAQNHEIQSILLLLHLLILPLLSPDGSNPAQSSRLLRHMIQHIHDHVIIKFISLLFSLSFLLACIRDVMM